MPDKSFDHKQFLSTVNTRPGVYQMFDIHKKILYVGKAKNLKNRLSSYFRGLLSDEPSIGQAGLSLKTQLLVSKIAAIEVTMTESESTALVLEQNLIKALKPPYNILLRDDKSYPYIIISDSSFPRIAFHRGLRKKKGSYFGPYPNAGAVFQSLNFLQKTFRIRQCEDSVFKNRSRPCLQYQINRCTAPCVDYISPEDYQADVSHVKLFLKGQSNNLMKQLADKMDSAADALDFEKAATLRDQISALRRIQSDHNMETGSGSIDIFALSKQSTQVCIHVMFIRDGRILGSKSYLQEDKLDESEQEFLLAFIAQFYLASGVREVPNEIIVNKEISIEDKQLFADVLADKVQRKINILFKVISQRQKWLQIAVEAAQQNLLQHLGTKASLLKRFQTLQDVLGLDEAPKRLECFDISHTGGELTVASCVVFDQQGALKSDYRRFNIEGITGGDDYAAMEQALTRRYVRLQKGEGVHPDLLIIDGGKGQLSTAKAVLEELGVHQVMLLGIAKGTTRKAGFETLVFTDGRELTLNSDSPALHLLQEIRDEAHRFAITGHKQRRDKKRRTSTLEGIPGVGAKRRKELLRHFGGLRIIEQATVTDLLKVPGISKKIAEDIYSALRNE
jgi:excinuclease ABC subunit C